MIQIGSLVGWHFCVVLVTCYAGILAAAGGRQDRRTVLKTDYTNLVAFVDGQINNEDGLYTDLRYDIEDMQSLSSVLTMPQLPFLRPSKVKAEVYVTGEDTLDAAYRILQSNRMDRVAILNFANSIHPCGGVEHGSSAQEEEICRRSLLAYALMPKFNKKLWRKGSKYRIPDNGLIYTPDVPFLLTRQRSNSVVGLDFQKDIYPSIPKVDVISSAAVDLKSKDRGNYKSRMTTKIQSQLAAAALKGVNHIVLGAFGCGAFGGNPKEVSQLYQEALQRYGKLFKTVTFAIFDPPGRSTPNISAFRKNLVPDFAFAGNDKERYMVMKYKPGRSLPGSEVRWLPSKQLFISLKDCMASEATRLICRDGDCTNLEVSNQGAMSKPRAIGRIRKRQGTMNILKLWRTMKVVPLPSPATQTSDAESCVLYVDEFFYSVQKFKLRGSSYVDIKHKVAVASGDNDILPNTARLYLQAKVRSLSRQQLPELKTGPIQRARSHGFSYEPYPGRPTIDGDTVTLNYRVYEDSYSVEESAVPATRDLQFSLLECKNGNLYFSYNLDANALVLRPARSFDGLYPAICTPDVPRDGFVFNSPVNMNTNEYEDAKCVLYFDPKNVDYIWSNDFAGYLLMPKEQEVKSSHHINFGKKVPKKLELFL